MQLLHFYADDKNSKIMKKIKNIFATTKIKCR